MASLERLSAHLTQVAVTEASWRVAVSYCGREQPQVSSSCLATAVGATSARIGRVSTLARP